MSVIVLSSTDIFLFRKGQNIFFTIVRANILPVEPKICIQFEGYCLLWDYPGHLSGLFKNLKHRHMSRAFLMFWRKINMAKAGLFGVLAEIAKVTDEATAYLIAENFGGYEIHIPKQRFNNRNPLVKLIGSEKVELISKEIGVGTIKIPQAGLRGTTVNQWLLRDLIEQGASTREIISQTGYSARHISRARGGRNPLIEKLLKENKSPSEIAEQTGFDKGYIGRIAKQLGFLTSKPSSINKRRLKIQKENRGKK